MSRLRLAASFLLYDCHVGWPGSSGDSTVWASRPFMNGLEGLETGDPGQLRGGFLPPHHFMMGDGGYTISTSVLTPFSTVACAGRLDRVYFNYKQSKARRCVLSIACSLRSLVVSLSPHLS